MHAGLYEDDARLTSRTLAVRCRALGLPAWRWDARGSITLEPGEWGAADAWLRGPLLTEWIRKAAASWHGQQPRSHELFPGCWLLPVGHPASRRGAAATIALGLCPEALQSEQFHALCGAARLDVAAARSMLAPLARMTGDDLERTAMVLRWMQDDLEQAGQDQLALHGFSAQLADVYEQLNVVYRLGLSMNRLNDPEEFVNIACTLLQATLEFAWIAVQPCASSRASHTGLSDLVIAGLMPGSRRRFDELSVQAVRGLVAHGQKIILLDPAEGGLAAFVGSQVVVRPVTCGQEVVATILAGNKGGRDPEVSSIDTQLIDAVADYLGGFLHNVSMYGEQRDLFFGTVRALTAVIDAKDQYTRGHSERVAYLASQLGRAAGCDEEMVQQIRIAGLVHDIGKIGVPESVLGKRDRLTRAEFDQLKRHPVIGYDILKDIPPMSEALPGVLHHHERWDGSGYPEGRRGENIPYIARILAVADSFDAMSSDRSYRTAIRCEEVLEEIERCAGTQFDPQLARCFLTLDLARYDVLVSRHREQEGQAA